MIGKEILNYRIESLIGRGGMGSVYLAVNKHINQKVAIKVLHKNLVESVIVRQKFVQEAQTLLTLNNPNIVKFLNFYENEDGVFLITEYVDGITLDDFINNKNGLIVEDRIYELFNQILDAFAYAHHSGIVHRDIKPANIMLTSDQEGNFVVKILDFGIARIISESNDDEKGLVVGTPLYMSPEQMQGENLDKRSDIYSLGVLLHQMLTGRAPYNTTTLTDLELQQKVVEDPLPRMKEYYQYISDRMQKVVDKATAKDPAARYQQCTVFRKDLNPRPPMPLRLKIAGAAVIVLLLAGSWWFWDYNYHTKISYYKDYVEQWGVPKGIGKADYQRRERTYRFEYKKGKLLHLALVNSKGKVVDDNESERFDRPVNADFEYHGNDIAYVLYKDKNGKALFRKRFNKKEGKIVMFVFEYNDDNGTEKRLPKNLRGYMRLENENADRGQISRFALELDEKGYIRSLHYRNRDGNPIGDQDRIYGKRYERDEAGRVIKEYFLAGNDSLKATPWGLGVKHFIYDKDHLIKVEYLSPIGSPSYEDKDGTAVYEMEYDENGNMTYAWYKTSDGALMLPKKQGVAGIKQKFNKKGEITEAYYMGIDRQPMYNPEEGTIGAKFEYDEFGFVKKVTYIDENGNPIVSGSGNTYILRKNDSSGNPLEESYYDINGQPFEVQYGYYKGVAEYDSLGNQTSCFYYNTDDSLCISASGFAGVSYVFNDKNMLIEKTYYGSNNNLCEVDGVVTVKYEYSPFGNETRRVFYKADGQTLASDDDGIAGWESKYDENGNKTEQLFFDDKGHRTAGTLGYASWIATYDASGNREELRNLDQNGQLVFVASDGYATIKYKHDNRGNVTEINRYDANMKLIGNIERFQYDQRDNKIEIAYYDRNNNQVLGQRGYFKIVSVYDDRNQEIEQRFYNTSNRVFAPKGDSYAIVRYQFDNRGNEIETTFFNENEKPISNQEGYATHKSEYDAMGRIIRQTFYDENGQPTKPSIQVPEGLAGYDKWGNMNYLASADGQGNLIDNPQTGWSVKRWVYDFKGNILEVMVFDKIDQPIIDKDQKAHKISNIYNKQNQRIEERYYSTPDDLRKENFAIARLKYNEQGNVVEITYFDNSDKAVDANNVAHKLLYSYDERGENSVLKRYKVNGSLESTLKWNKQNNEWELEKNIRPAWIESIRQMAVKCPMQYSDQIELSSISVKSAGCDVILRFKEISKYNISDVELDECKAITNKFAGMLKQESGMPGNTRLTMIVVDKASRELLRLTF